MKTNNISACMRKAQLSFEMLLGQCKVCLPTEKTVPKYGNSFISQTAPCRFPVDALEAVKKTEF